ncbi:hypothetical protein [Mesorhizobium sp. M0676]|uniref:hypothetical protein n=1 Tax=Mesorhizobium sp. M0676 TaxID=2956984 RepID=UPI0033353065
MTSGTLSFNVAFPVTNSQRSDLMRGPREARRARITSPDGNWRTLMRLRFTMSPSSPFSNCFAFWVALHFGLVINVQSPKGLRQIQCVY